MESNRRWRVALVVAAVAGLVPVLGVCVVTRIADGGGGYVWGVAACVVATFVLAGPAVAAFALSGTGKWRLVFAGALALGLVPAYLVSQHRPDSVMPPPWSDWIVPYAWLAALTCVGAALVRRVRRPDPPPSAYRTATGAVVLAFALCFANCVGYLIAMEDLESDGPAARPNQRAELPLPPGWTAPGGYDIEEGQVGFVADVQPVDGIPRDEAQRQLSAFLCDQRGWCTPCRPVRGILPWGRHCLTIAESPDDVRRLRVTVVKERAYGDARNG
jgi:hypothetical protein